MVQQDSNGNDMAQGRKFREGNNQLASLMWKQEEKSAKCKSLLQCRVIICGAQWQQEMTLTG